MDNILLWSGTFGPKRPPGLWIALIESCFNIKVFILPCMSKHSSDLSANRFEFMKVWNIEGIRFGYFCIVGFDIVLFCP